VVVAVIAVIMSSFYVVDQREEAVVLRFGRFLTIAGPGLHLKLPFGLDRNLNVPTQQILTMEFGYQTQQAGVRTVFSNQDFPEVSTMLTGDLNIVDVEWSIQYRVADPRAYLFNVQDQEKTISDISQSVINELVGDRGILDVIGQERQSIESLSLVNMNRLYDSYEIGVRVVAVKLQNIVPPAGEVQDAFEDVNKAVQDRSRLINEGKEAYNQAIPRARGEAQQIIQEAEAYRLERVNRANGDASRFVAVAREYDLAPGITKTRLYLEMHDDVFRNSEGTQLIDRNLTNFIPLLQLGGGGALSGGTQ
jgi:membrane protease subunit HflK